MVESVTFTFSTPLQQENLISVCSQVTTALSDEEKRYFLSSFVSLLQFAMDKLIDRQRVTLAVARKTEESNSDGQWRKQKVWVKVKTTGGSAGRVNYMATSFGIAQVDWKNNTRMYLGIVPAAICIDVMDKYCIRTLFVDFPKSKTLFRRSQNLHINARAFTVFGDILLMQPSTVAEMVTDPKKLRQVATELFQIFDEDSSGEMGQSEFLECFSHFLHQPTDPSVALFQAYMQLNQTIGVKQFTRLFQEFLQEWLEEENQKGLAFFWNYQINSMADKPSIEVRMAAISDEKSLILLQNLLQQYTFSPNISWEMYQHLSNSLDKALYREATSAEILQKKFNEMAENGEITVQHYVKEIKKAMLEIVDFLEDWENVMKISKSVYCQTREETLAMRTNIESIRAVISRSFHCFGATNCLNYQQLVRHARCSNIPTVITMTEKQKREVNVSLEEACQAALLHVLDDVNHPGKADFLEIAQKTVEELIALTAEEYRLKEIANDIFSEVFPVRDSHDFATFQTYANVMCEIFQVENAEETAHHLFTNFNTAGEVTARDLTLILKQLIGHQVKWAKTREIQESLQKQQFRDIQRNPESLRMMVKDLFSAADTNHDGWVDRSELKQALQTFSSSEEIPFDKSDEEVNALFERLDVDCDGKLSLEEYQVFVVELLEADASR